MPVKNLLSIDGGGIKGIIPACMLVELERQLGGKRTRDIFHFVAGTSTGAILTAGIAAGVPATDMLDLYLTRGREIFPAHRRTALIKLVMRLAFGHAYSTSRLQQVLSEELAKATEWNLDRHPDNPSPDLWTLNDADIDLLITAKRVSDGEPWYFVRDHPGRNRCRTGLLSLVDCITASAAAPFYFHPWEVPDVLDLLPDEVLNNLPERALEPLGELVDGGVGVEGNPVYQACVEAFRYTPGYIPQNTIVVSLGTGQYLGSKGRPRTGYGWLSWLVGELLRSSNEQQTYATYDLLPTGTPFYRLDVVLDRDIDMDAADQVQVLEEYGTEFARKVDWERILNGADTRYLVRPDRRYPFQYAQPVH